MTDRRRPVIFIHGLWLHASSWEHWAGMFEEAGHAPVSPGWPDDPETVEEAAAYPETFARKGVGAADHLEKVGPTAIAKASFEKERKNEGVTEFVEVPGRGHALIIDSGWRDVAQIALGFFQRFAT